MSACIRCLYSSDQCAPGFWFALLGGRGAGGALVSAGLRAPTFNLSVGRAVGGFWEFESFIRILMHQGEWIDWEILLED